MVPTVLGGFRFTGDEFFINHGTREPCFEKTSSWGRAHTARSDEPETLHIVSAWASDSHPTFGATNIEREIE